MGKSWASGDIEAVHDPAIQNCCYYRHSGWVATPSGGLRVLVDKQRGNRRLFRYFEEFAVSPAFDGEVELFQKHYDER